MSNFFEQELRKLFADGAVIHDPVFVGRACLGGLDRNRQVRAEFVTLGHADHYAALRLTLLDSNQGVVDKLTLRFKDVWGKQKIPNNPYLRDGAGLAGHRPCTHSVRYQCCVWQGMRRCAFNRYRVDHQW